MSRRTNPIINFLLQNTNSTLGGRFDSQHIYGYALSQARPPRFAVMDFLKTKGIIG